MMNENADIQTGLPINIKVKTIDSNEYKIEIKSDSKIEELKKQIENVRFFD